jgi:hypothetical protein
MSLRIVPVTLAVANAFVAERHRHHKPVRWNKYSVAVADADGVMRGVAIVNRPVSRTLDDGSALEVSRLCTDGAPNACSMLYRAAWRVAREMGFLRMFTYTLATEPGTSLLAAGWRNEGLVRGQPWSKGKRASHRTDKAPTCDKQRWSISRGATQ